MALHPLFVQACGDWQGNNQLWFYPGDEAHGSAATAHVSLAAQGKFLSMQYTWAHEGQPHEGLLLFGLESPTGQARAAWVDSFHMGDVMMVLQGSVNTQGQVDLLGVYAAPPDPDWGWRIVLEPTQTGSLRMLMYNITPAGEQALAVEMTLTRQP
jgi:hypothetical protein